MILKPIQIVLDESGNQIDLNYRPIRSHSNYKHIIQIVAPNLATEACDITISTYGREIEQKTIRTRLAMDMDGNYIKGADVVNNTEIYFNATQEYNVWEVELVGTVASVLQKINSGKIGIVVSFSMPVKDSRALVNIGNFGKDGDIPVITTAVEGDYLICDLLAFTSTLINVDFKYNDIAIYDGEEWYKGAAFRMTQTCPMIQLSIDPSFKLMYDEIDDDNATLLIDDIARLDGVISNTQGIVQGIQQDNVDINVALGVLEQEDIDINVALGVLEQEDIDINEKLGTIEGTISSIEGDITYTIKNDISILQGDVSGINSSIGTIEGDITLLEQADITLASNINKKVNITSNPIVGFNANSSTYVLTFTYLDGSTSVFDLPAEMAFTNASYDNVTKDLTFTLQSGTTVAVPLDDIITGLATETWVNNKLGGLFKDVSVSTENNTITFTKFDNTTKTVILPVSEGGGVGTDTNTYVASGAYNNTTKNLTLTMSDESTVVISLAAIEVGDVEGGITSAYLASELLNYYTKTEVNALLPADSDDISEGATNLYYTEERVSANEDVVSNTAKISFDSTSSAKLGTIEEGAEVNADLATKAEAEAGTDNTATMTPLRVKEAIDELVDLSPFLTSSSTLDASKLSGAIPLNSVPTIAITSTQVVASQVTQLALTAQEGDVAIRTDLNKTYIHNGGIAGTMADWTELLFPDLFTAWDKKSGISITESQISDLQDYLIEETHISIDTMEDISLSTLNDGDILSWDDTAKHWVNEEAPTPVDVNATNQGNTFNGNSQLVKLDATGKLPVLDGSNLTGLVTTTEYTATIAKTDWTGETAPFSKAVTVAGIVATDRPIVDLDLSSATYSDIVDIESGWSNIYRGVTSADTITFYTSEVPTIAIPITIKVVG